MHVTIFITDGKFDDAAALAKLMRKLADGQTIINVIITNVHNVSGAMGLLENVAKDVYDKLPKDKAPAVFFFYKYLRTEPHDWEAPTFLNQSYHGTMYEYIQDTPYTSYDYDVVALAPCVEFLEMLQNARVVYIGLGYNTRKFTLEQLKSIKGLVMINNRAAYTDGTEGGRFSTDDNELWAYVINLSETLYLTSLRAQKDSVGFIVKRLHENGITDATIDNIFDDNILEQAERALANDPDNTYLFRSVDQLRRKRVDVECSDGQHVAIWYGAPDNIHRAKLVQKKEYITYEYDPEGDYIGIFNLTPQMTRSLFMKD